MIVQEFLVHGGFGGAAFGGEAYLVSVLGRKSDVDKAGLEIVEAEQ